MSTTMILSFVSVVPVSVRSRHGARCAMNQPGVEVIPAPNLDLFRNEVAGTWAGRMATFSGVGKFLSEQTVTTTVEVNSEGTPMLRSMDENGTLLIHRDLEPRMCMGFEDGSFSWGPEIAEAPFEVESCVADRSGGRLRVIHGFDVSGTLQGIAMCRELKGTNAPDSFGKTPRLQGKDIAGNWKSNNMICQYNDGETIQVCTIADIERTYYEQTSSSPSLVLLPLFLSSVAQKQFLQNREYSVGIGWSVNETTRAVMIRRHSNTGRFVRTAYRLEYKL